MAKKATASGAAILKKLRAFGLAYPGAHSKSPWPGHDDLAVNDKTFAYLSAEGEPFSLSVKLPFTAYEALKLPYATPTAYGLGKSGWVTLTPKSAALPPLAQLQSWIDESYRAQAPKKLIAQIGGGPAATKPVARPAAKPAPKPASKRRAR